MEYLKFIMRYLKRVSMSALKEFREKWHYLEFIQLIIKKYRHFSDNKPVITMTAELAVKAVKNACLNVADSSGII